MVCNLRMTLTANILSTTITRHRSLGTPSKRLASVTVRVFTDSRERSSLSPCSVRTVAVVGHDHCGGVITAIDQVFPSHPPYEDQLEHNYALHDSLYHSTHEDELNDVYDKNSKSPDNAITRWLTPLVKRVWEIRDSLPTDKEERLKIVTEENVKLQIENIAQLDREWVRKHGPIWVHGWVYDFSTGFIRDLKITRKLV